MADEGGKPQSDDKEFPEEGEDVTTAEDHEEPPSQPADGALEATAGNDSHSNKRTGRGSSTSTAGGDDSQSTKRPGSSSAASTAPQPKSSPSTAQGRPHTTKATTSYESALPPTQPPPHSQKSSFTATSPVSAPNGLSAPLKPVEAAASTASGASRPLQGGVLAGRARPAITQPPSHSRLATAPASNPQQPSALPDQHTRRAAQAPVPSLAAQGAQSQTIRRYLDETVLPVLRAGMRDLCTERPEDPWQFLADYILAHKPT